jgi:hypothetical protein
MVKDKSHNKNTITYVLKLKTNTEKEKNSEI